MGVKDISRRSRAFSGFLKGLRAHDSGYVPVGESADGIEARARRPVSRVLSAPVLVRDDHSSGTHLAARLTRPTRTAERECPCALRRGRPYSVLLPVGFALPPLSPGARGALAAPFRPCPRAASPRLARAVCFLWHFPWGRPRRRLSGTAFPWSPDFPLPLTRQRPSGRLAAHQLRVIMEPVKRLRRAATGPTASHGCRRPPRP